LTGWGGRFTSRRFDSTLLLCAFLLGRPKEKPTCSRREKGKTHLRKSKVVKAITLRDLLKSKE